MITNPTLCLECNAPLSPAETQGLCARCLLKMGLASQFGESSVADAGARKFVPPPMFPFDFGGYRVLRLLGRGGMGAVYEAEQRETGRRVALKVLGQTIDSPEMRKRFLREGRLAAAINHPNSVYIFGTEEIEGAPVIAMELVAGGTLKDALKRRGPLPVRDAVDAILGVIAGLEAAHAGGVLHRDVKPANCFVAPDGTVKVGDFGLSVSTLARQDSQLTQSGVLLGTPSFAPPEQLRGEELDVRADIYSVGATLYALLTGHAPFEGENAVLVVAAVLDKTPAPIPGVPDGLARIVARCLAKKRGERFSHYAALRDALLPFSAVVPDPAPLGTRFLASSIDACFAQLPGIIALFTLGFPTYTGWVAQGTPQALLGYVGGVLVFSILYYALCEGRLGAGLGKAVCGLRVIGPDGSAPGFRRALGRASITEIALQSGVLLTLALIARGGYVYHFPHWVDWAWLPLWCPLITTMRRRNGFAAVQDLATGTRVVVRQRSTARAPFEWVPAAVPAEHAARVGPYLLAGEGVGYDPVLRRHVWLRKHGALTEARRDLARPGRLRWLGEVEAWQVFEAPGGRALRDLPEHSQPWSSVRAWLADLAHELDAAARDGSVQERCSLASVLIAARGRALLLDEPLDSDDARTFDLTSPTGAAQFLEAVAAHALDRRSAPLHATEFLTKLGAGAFDRVSFIAGNLQSLLARPAEVTRGRRAASIFATPISCAFIAILYVICVVGGDARLTREITRQHPDFAELPAALTIYDLSLVQAGVHRKPATGNRDPFMVATVAAAQGVSEAAPKFISYRSGTLIDDPRFDEISGRVFDQAERDLARQAVRSYPRVTPEEFTAASAAMAGSLQRYSSFQRFEQSMGPDIFVVLLVLSALMQAVSMLLFAVVPDLWMFGLAVVDRRGQSAGRLRVLARGVIAWAPIVVLMLLFLIPNPIGPMKLTFLFILLIYPLLMFVTALHPAGGPHEALTGTRVVRR